MSTPFAIAATLNIPGDSGLPADPIPFTVSAQYTQLSSQVLSLTGTGSKAVGFGSIGGAGVIAILIKVDPGVSVQPIQLTINAGSEPIEISGGGGFLYANPTPSAGITSLSIAYTSACTVRIWLLGP